jgi:hypothetical protein
MQKILLGALFSALTCIGCTQPSNASNQAHEDRPITASSQPVAEASLCQPDEVVIFSCRIRNSGNLASLCASKDFGSKSGATVQYAFGKPGAVELEFPEKPEPAPGSLRRSHLVYAGATGGYAYTFTNGGFKYHLYSISGTNLEDQGIVVAQHEKVVAELKCDTRSVVLPENTKVIDALLEWPEDPDVAEHGLP